jgi:Xaa-Pro aminopeptidase
MSHESKIRDAARFRGQRNAQFDALTDPDMSHLYGDRVDRKAMRAYRLRRTREQLAARDLAGIVLYDPVNIRYATGARNMAVWTLHNPVRYAFVATDGPVILFDFHGSKHLSFDIETIDEVRPALPWYHFATGDRSAEVAETWADEIAELVRRHGGGNARIAADQLRQEGLHALTRRGVEVHNGEAPMERARVIKGPEELAAMQIAVDACEAGVAAMRAALKPGITENELWAILHHENIARGGEWVETRLLASGPRTNPWFHECSDRVIQAGDLVGFDTDLVGPFGYCVDMSRTWVCGDGPPSDEQRRLHATALEQIDYNKRLLQPGASFREITEKAWPMPDDLRANRYSVIAHGVGFCDEWPGLYYPEDFETVGYDGVLEENTVLSVESYIGREGGREGVKLEQQLLIRAGGPVELTSYPMDL